MQIGPAWPGYWMGWGGLGKYLIKRHVLSQINSPSFDCEKTEYTACKNSKTTQNCYLTYDGGNGVVSKRTENQQYQWATEEAANCISPSRLYVKLNK